MALSVTFRPSVARGPVTLLSPRPRPALYRARGVAVGDLSGGTVTMRLTWDLLRPGQIAVCRQSFTTRGDGATSTLTVQAGGFMEAGMIDNAVISRYGGSSGNAASEGTSSRLVIPIVVRQTDQAADMPFLDLIWSVNTNAIQYRWLSWWIVADLVRSTPDDIQTLLSLPQDVHP